MISNLVIALGLYAILGKAFPQPQVDQFWVNDDSSVEESYEIAVLNSENYKTNPFTGLDVDGGVDPEPVHVEETLISYEGKLSTTLVPLKKKSITPTKELKLKTCSYRA